MGFLLTQKTCQCKGCDPYCCPAGWKIILAGSRFCTGAESRNGPVEGEAKAIGWALGQTRHYTLGNRQLIVGTDHKPLLKIFGERKFEDIHTPRLLKLKEQTLSWNFSVIHVPGKTRVGPDLLSRRENVNFITVNLMKQEESDIDDQEEVRDMEAQPTHQVMMTVPSPVT